MVCMVLINLEQGAEKCSWELLPEFVLNEGATAIVSMQWCRESFSGL